MPIVTQAQYLAEMNRRLQLHEDYQPGMRFFAFPPGALPEQATGYKWEPDVPGNPHPFQSIKHAMDADGWGI